jgi:hypothetical protein
MWITQVAVQAVLVTSVPLLESVSVSVVEPDTVTVTSSELPLVPPVRAAEALRMTPVRGVAVAVLAVVLVGAGV